MDWIKADDELPEDGETVLIKTNHTHILDGRGGFQQYHVATFRRGRVPKAGESICNADQHGNNKRPYCWTDGSFMCNGQDATHWARITPPEG